MCSEVVNTHVFSVHRTIDEGCVNIVGIIRV
jgi:hypothetical protein